MILNLSKKQLALALSYILIIGIKRQLLSSNPQIMSALVDKHHPEPSTEMSDAPEASTETYTYLSLMFLQRLIQCLAFSQAIPWQTPACSTRDALNFLSALILPIALFSSINVYIKVLPEFVDNALPHPLIQWVFLLALQKLALRFPPQEMQAQTPRFTHNSSSQPAPFTPPPPFK